MPTRQGTATRRWRRGVFFLRIKTFELFVGNNPCSGIFYVTHFFLHSFIICWNASRDQNQITYIISCVYICVLYVLVLLGYSGVCTRGVFLFCAVERKNRSRNYLQNITSVCWNDIVLVYKMCDVLWEGRSRQGEEEEGINMRLLFRIVRAYMCTHGYLNDNDRIYFNNSSSWDKYEIIACSNLHECVR